ncbi:MAG: hypothetical protein ABSD02_00990 [Steroidobacteraceae bacterium]|jgi:hypothetical protein
MKAIAICAGLLIALSANAQDPLRAKLVGQRVVSSYPGTPILVCQYAGPGAKYEVVASAGTCARYIKLN